MNLFIDFSNEKDHPSIHDRYLSGRYSQTYPSRKQDTPEFFFPGTGIRTEEKKERTTGTNTRYEAI